MKFKMGQAFSVANEAFQESIGRLFLNLIVSIGVILIPIIAFVVAIFASLAGDFGLGSLIVFLLLGLAVVFLVAVMQNISICIISDNIDGVKRSYGEQFHFTFQHGLKIIAANFLALLPITIAFAIFVYASVSSGTVEAMIYESIDLQLIILFFVMSLYMVFTLFIGHAILLEEKSILESISRSFSIVSKNYLKVMLLYIVINVVTGVISYFTADINFLLQLIVSILQAVFGFYSSCYLVTLFKQVQNKNDYDEMIETSSIFDE